jgi:hypothetical protein
VVFFVAAAWKADAKIAAAVVPAFVAGTFLHFDVVRAVLLWLRGGPKPTSREFALGTVGRVAGGLLVHLGSGIVLALWKAVALVIDASASIGRILGAR